MGKGGASDFITKVCFLNSQNYKTCRNSTRFKSNWIDWISAFTHIETKEKHHYLPRVSSSMHARDAWPGPDQGSDHRWICVLECRFCVPVLPGFNLAEPCSCYSLFSRGVLLSLDRHGWMGQERGLPFPLIIFHGFLCAPLTPLKDGWMS